MKRARVTPFKALLSIFLSVCFVMGFSVVALQLYYKWEASRAKDLRNRITSIVQTGPQKERVTTEYLAELLALSVDRPISIHQFDPKKAEKRLLTSPLIKEAKVSLLKPSSVCVSYVVRKPVAWVSEYENIAVDSEGYLFPVYPFFTPKELPELVLGLFPFESVPENSDSLCGRWGKPLKGKSMDIAFELLAATEDLPVRRIDLSHLCAPSLGTREIVLYLEEKKSQFAEGKETVSLKPYLVRLSAKNYQKELVQFRQYLKSSPAASLADLAQAKSEANTMTFPLKVLDFRLEDIAFVEQKAPR